MDQSTKASLRTGNTIPILGLGTWELTHHTVDAVAHALEIGYRMIDTSSDYGTQSGIGKAIKRVGIPRDQLYIVTKVEETDDAYARTQSNLEELQLDYVDLLLIHRPPAIGAGEELWEGLMQAKEDGLTRDIGVSNYSIELIEELIPSGQTPVVNQIEWTPFGHSDEMEQYCDNRQILIMAYSPLTRRTQLNDPILRSLAKKYDKSTAQILLRWDVQRGNIPIPKANQLEHQEENLEVFDFTLRDKDIELLNSLNEDYSSLGRLAYV